MFNSKQLALFFLLALPAFGQMYATDVTNGGSGYTSVPTATITANGSCTTPPVLGTVVLGTGNTVGSVPVKYAGVCPLGGAAPTISITGGGGSGATVIGEMLGGSIAILDSVQVDANNNPSTSGTNIMYRFECTLVVPSALTYFYSPTTNPSGLDRMPYTSQASSIIWAAVSYSGQSAAAVQQYYTTAYAAGVLTAYDYFDVFTSGTIAATVEADIVNRCATQQTNLNAWNSWANYGTYYNGTTWVAATIQ